MSSFGPDTAIGSCPGPLPPTVSSDPKIAIPSLHPHTGHIYNAFQRLLDMIEQLKLNWERYNERAGHVIVHFDCELKVEFAVFKQTFSDLTDTWSEIKGNDWYSVEEATFRRCDSHYGRYIDSLGKMKIGLAKIALCLRLTNDEDDLESPTRTIGTSLSPWNVQIRDLLADPDQRNAFLSTLLTITGAAGGALQLHVSTIRDANEQLKTISREAKRKPSPVLFQRLDALRARAKMTADVLGDENGFACECNPPHRVFIRLSDCPDLDSSEPQLQSQGHVCNLTMRNVSPVNASSWEWVSLNTEVLEDPDDGLPNLPAGSSDRSSAGQVESVSKRSSSSQQGHHKFTRVVRWADQHLKKSKQPQETTTTGQVASSSMKLSAVPDMGLCAFIHYHHQGIQGRHPDTQIPEIVLSRHQSKLRIKLQHDGIDTAKSWVDSASIQNQFANVDHPGLSTEQKLQLAYSVGFSLFYLHSTPWLHQGWTSDDVYLPKQDSGLKSIEPWLAKPITTHISSTKNHGTSHDMAEMTPILTRFGRFLIEICYGAAWSQIRKVFLAGHRPSLDVDADLVVFSNMFSWAHDHKIATADKPCYLEGNSYFEAIRTCFAKGHGLQDSGSASMEDAEFRIEVYQHILRPLKFALEDFRERQSRMFGRVVVSEDRQTSPVASQEGKPFLLFDDEEVKGDTEQKSKIADKWFFKYDLAMTLISHPRPNNPQNRIRIAVLDTGVDVTHDLLRGPWMKRQIIYQDFVGPGTDIPEDQHGHGTHVTSIILRVAENVDVYVGRISPDGARFKSSQVTKAIEWAVEEKKVHIISMSFGFPDVDQSLEPIRQAILKAHAKDVLVFAATGNRGKGHPISFPACMDECISVGSTDGNHQISDFVPTLGAGKRLCTIGEAINAAWICKDQKNSHVTCVRKAGTSYATPVAAGVAAMVMDFVCSGQRQRNTGGSPAAEAYEYQTLRTKRGMLAVLAQMTMRDNSVDYLTPWKLFNPTTAKPHDGETISGILHVIISTLRMVYTASQPT